MAETVRTFIDDHGGNAAVAKATGNSEGAVALWVHRNRLPRSAWPEMMKAFETATLDRLLALEAGVHPTSPAANDASAQERAA